MLHRPILGTLLCALCLIVPANATGGGTNQNLQCPCETSSNSVSVTGPNKNTSFSCDTSIQPFIDRAGMVIVVTDRNGKRSVRGGCGMKTLKWHAQDFGDTLCQANASQMNSYLAQMDHNDALICTENGPKIIKAAGNGLACNRDAIKEERIPLFAGERMRIYYHHAWSPTGDGAGAGGTVASGNCSGECLDLKDNNNNGVADVVDMRSGKNLNGNYNFYYPTFSGNFRVHSSNLPWVQTNGYVEQQNMNLYAPNKGLFTGADTHGLELDKARHEYAILLNNTDGTDALGVKIRAAARPRTPCGDQVQSFEVHAEKSDGSRTELGKINMRPYASIPVFQTYTFPFNSGEVGYSKIILKERSSCRTSNFYGGSLISQVWTAKRDPACKDPKDPETKNPPKQCSDGIDNDGDGRIDYNTDPAWHDPGCESPEDDDEWDDGTCLDGIDNEGDGWIDMQDPLDCGPGSKGSETGGQVLVPRASCKESFSDYTYYHVGFANFTGSTQNISVGTNTTQRANYYTLNGAAYTPYNSTETFPTGVKDGFFSVVIPSAQANKTVNWFLGVDGKIEGISLDSSMPDCPETDVIFVSCQNGQATFGIDNQKSFDPLYRYNRQNQFSPAPSYRQQGVRFADQQTITVPASNGDTWTLAGNSATVSNCN